MDSAVVRSLVALTPQDVVPAQQQLAVWCRGKIRSLAAECREAVENTRIAKQNKWRHSGSQAVVNRTKKRIHYYRKIMAAVEAGYLVVPNFNVEVMAVRVRDDGQDPPFVEEEYLSAGVANAMPVLSLPVGAGRYVDEKHRVSKRSDTKVDSKGNTKAITMYGSDKYQIPDFPVKLVKPVILEATQRAMALRIFDRIGVVTGKKTDPIVLGQIVDPVGSPYLHLNLDGEKRVSFFIAWWLDPETL